MHSDDYRYYLLGISLEAQFNHYITWSGRFVVDYANSLLFFTHNHSSYIPLLRIFPGCILLVHCKNPAGTLH
ncbi:MAG: hypothetical protein ACR5LD_07150 [Symbiopectobacterium sp.]